MYMNPLSKILLNLYVLYIPSIVLTSPYRMDFLSLSKRIREILENLENEVTNPRSAESAPSAPEVELCELLGVPLRSKDCACYAKAASTGRQCRGEISRQQRHMANLLLRSASRAFQKEGTDLKRLMELYERIPSYLLCQHHQQKLSSRLAVDWMLKTMHYQFVEPGMCQPCTKTSLEPIMEMLNSIGKRLMADGHLSAEACKAGHISFGEPDPEPEPELEPDPDPDPEPESESEPEPEPELEPEPEPRAEPEPEPKPKPKKHKPRSDIPAFYLCRYLNNLLLPHFNTLGRFSDRRARMPIVGDCQICMQRLRNKSLKKYWQYHNPVRSRDQQVKDPDYLTHCAQRCGQNFHAECMDEWIISCVKSRLPITCPNWYVV
ncbi:hypothetical protein RJ035_002311 [Blastomyces gilchristii]